MLKIATVDTEFNNEKKILSAGLVYSSNLNIIKLDEILFKESVDYRTYKIHGLNNKFLKKHGKQKYVYLPKLKEELLSQDFIVGFAIRQDIQVINLSKSLFNNFKIIDVDLIFRIFNLLNVSLEHVVKSLNLLDTHKSKYPIHTAIMDSILTFSLFSYLVNFIKNKTKYTEKEIVLDFAKMSFYKLEKKIDLINQMKDKYSCLFEIVDIIKKNEKTKIETKFLKVLFLKNSVEVYNQDMFIVGKYTHFFFKETFKENYEKIFIKKECCNFGFKDYIK